MPLWVAIAIAVLALIALIDRLFSPALGLVAALRPTCRPRLTA